ncbi:MAG: CapA family protein [Clostridia bacterium]|nr:CapA family protein [Clostridia bacterium]
MKKKLLCFLVALTTVFTFSACTKNTDSNTRQNQPTPTQTDTEVLSAPIEEIPEIIEYRTSFLGCGDNIIYGTKDALQNAVEGGRKYNYKVYYEGVAEQIANADIAFINQETLMCGEGYALSYYPCFNSPQELGYDLVEMGFDVVNISNNHMLDKSADGLEKTIAFWKGLDTLMIGGYENGEDFDTIRYLERDGVKIAFLSYTYGTNGIVKPKNSPLVIPYINDEDIIRQTALAKENADLVFVSVHWGVEGAFTPNDEQKRVAQLFADCGVDAIIGHHPHVIQPVEWIFGKDGNKTLCVYSLGNFMAQQAYDYNMLGGMISFDIVHTNEQGSVPHIENVLFIPTVFHFAGTFLENNVMPFEQYSPELAASHGVRTYFGHQMSYDTLLGYIKNTVKNEFLPEFYHDKAN